MRNTWAKSLLLYNIQNPIGLDANIAGAAVDVKIAESRLCFSLFLSSFLFSFQFIFIFLFLELWGWG